jgi:flagellar basal-body rod protein FlgB
MFARPEILTLASSLAAHAEKRQMLVAENVANADTPGYTARDLADFASIYRSDGDFGMRQTRPGHLANEPVLHLVLASSSGAGMSPNGNSVSLEREMVKSAEVQREHDLAIAVYGKSLDILRASLGRR